MSDIVDRLYKKGATKALPCFSLENEAADEIATIRGKLEAAESEARRQMQHVAATLQKLEEADRRSEYWKAEHLAGNAVITEQAAQIEALEKDAARIDWLQHWFMHSWNGVVGVGSSTIWSLCGDYRSRVAKMKGRKFREAIDAAMQVKLA